MCLSCGAKPAARGIKTVVLCEACRKLTEGQERGVKLEKQPGVKLEKQPT